MQRNQSTETCRRNKRILPNRRRQRWQRLSTKIQPGAGDSQLPEPRLLLPMLCTELSVSVPHPSRVGTCSIKCLSDPQGCRDPSESPELGAHSSPGPQCGKAALYEELPMLLPHVALCQVPRSSPIYPFKQSPSTLQFHTSSLPHLVQEAGDKLTPC